LAPRVQENHACKKVAINPSTNVAGRSSRKLLKFIQLQESYLLILRWYQPDPYRSPHHTISDAGLVGGGTYPQPGEISLAQNGVLFLDELPEFKRTVLEVMRQPMEDRIVTISRARVTVDYPASLCLLLP